MNRNERDEMDRRNKTRPFEYVDRAEFERLEQRISKLEAEAKSNDMLRRDRMELAGQALAGILASFPEDANFATDDAKQALAMDSYAIANAMLEEQERMDKEAPQPDSDGWIPWHGGGSCPVAGETMVDVRFRNYAEKMDRLASVFRWNHAGSATDIIAYRPAKQEAVPEWPQVGDAYWIVDSCLETFADHWNNDPTDKKRRAALGIYPTRAQAEEAAAKIKRVMEHLREVL